MAARAAKGRINEGRFLRVFELGLLAVCLCILALRATYTEAPMVQTSVVPGTLTDAVYSLTLSGILIFAFVLWLVVRACANRWAYRITGLEVGLVLFAVAAVLSGFVASDKRAAITQTTVLLAPVFAALLLAQILDSGARVHLVLIVLAALAVVATYQCAEQFFVSNQITIEQYEQDPNMLLTPLGIDRGTFQHFLFEHRLYSRGIRGFFTTSNSAASFAILASFAAGALLLHRLSNHKEHARDRWYVWLPALAVLLITVGLLLTQSKGGILAFAAGAILFSLFLYSSRSRDAHARRALTSLLLLALLLVVVLGCVVVRYGRKHDRLPGGNSMLVRWQYWAASARVYADHPVTGVGPGNFAYHYPHYKPPAALESVSDPHNILLSLATQYGPLGLLGFLAMILAVLWRVVGSVAEVPSAHESPPASPFKSLAVAMLLTLCGSLLLFRPMLIPTTTTGSLDVLLYEITTLYVAPVSAFLIGFLLLAAPFKQTDRDGSHVHRTVVLASLTGAVLAVLLHNLVDFAIFEPGVWMAFWIVIACLVAVSSRRRPAPPGPVRVGLVPKLAASVTALVLLGSYGLYVWRPVSRITSGIQAAQHAAGVGRFDEARALLDAAAAADPLCPAPHNLNGRLCLTQYEQTGRQQRALIEKAASYFRRAIDTNPADYKNYEKLAVAYHELGRWQEASEWYLTATRLYPGCERLWFQLAQTAEKLGRTDDALAYYTRAVEIEESYQRQFRQMYPERETVVSRLGDEDLRLARKRIEELSP